MAKLLFASNNVYSRLRGTIKITAVSLLLLVERSGPWFNNKVHFFHVMQTLRIYGIM